MNTFKVGQKVVYIMRSLPDIGLIKDQVYEVIDTTDCKCGQNLHVGIVSTHPFTYCSYCGEILNIDDRWFLNQEAFRPVVSESVSIEEEEKITVHFEF